MIQNKFQVKHLLLISFLLIELPSWAGSALASTSVMPEKTEAETSPPPVVTFRLKNVDCQDCVETIKKAVCSGGRQICSVKRTDKKKLLGELKVSPLPGESAVNKENIRAAIQKYGFDLE